MRRGGSNSHVEPLQQVVEKIRNHRPDGQAVMVVSFRQNLRGMVEIRSAVKANDSAQIEALPPVDFAAAATIGRHSLEGAAQIYAALNPDDQTKVGNTIDMLTRGGFGSGMRRGGHPKQ